jgi:outer membrane receptor protein involved in Fe transport
MRHQGAPAGALIATALAIPVALAQTAPSSSNPRADEEETLVLSPFEVSAEQENNGYETSATLAGNRLNTDLKDLGTSLSIYNTQFLKDIGATDSRSLLKYTLGTEIGGINGNYSGSGGGTSPDRDASYLRPESTNRVRGLVSADTTRDLYLTSIPWDSYNVEAVDIQRGPNAILFGQGSPGGVINTRGKQASYRNLGELNIRFDEYGSFRGSLDVNRVILKDELALRIATVYNETEFKQKPAFEDFDREYLAFRYEPKFLKKGGARTIFKFDGELGSSRSNRPRNMPPGDRITPWFTALGKRLYNTAWLNDGNWGIPGRGDAARNNPQNQPNPNFEPWVGGNGTNFGNNYFGGSIFFFESGQTTPALGMAINPNQYLGLNINGQRDGNIGGLAPSQPRGVAGYRDWAITTNQPFATLTKNTFITDPRIFNFYDNLLDGNIKREWSDFHAYNVSLSQTFFQDKLGFDIGYHDERYKSGSYSPLIGENGSLFIDFNSVWPDGSNTPETGWYLDGTPNIGAGRPFVQLGNGEGRSIHDRESVRATAFVTHDFDRDRRSHWLLRLLGQHTVTGMASRDTSFRYSQNWVKSTFIGDYYNHPMFAEIKANNGRFWADFVPIRTVYVGPSLLNKNIGDNFGITAPSIDPQLGDKVTLRYFDPTWIATGVNPADPWYNQVTAGLPGGPALSTQSENPANYRGWVTRQVSLLRDDTAANREFLTTGREWDDRYNDAYAFVWQGKFWNDSIIATAGMRHDEVGQTITRWNRDESTEDPTQIPYQVSETGPFKEDSNSWGVVVHFDRLPWLGNLMKRSPISVSATYNKSNNFQTGQVFRDYFGQELPLPEGETEDMGIMLATKNNRYSLRVNKFESRVANNVSSGLQFWNYGNNIGIYAQAYHQIKHNYETRSNPNSPRHGNNIVSGLPVPTPGAPNPKWNFDYQPLNGQTLQEAEQLEVAVINAWDAWLQEMAPLPQIMAQAWGFNYTDDFTEQGLDFRFTEDLLAEGYEMELHAQVTDSWRLTVNASRIKSYRDNISQTPAPGGEMTVIEYLLDFDRRMNETVMGDLRIWGPGGSATARENWRGYADGDLKARLAEQGTVVPENRLWHVNLVSNYDFRTGALKGWNVGGAARYQSAATLAYKPVQSANYISYDLTSPYRDDDQLDFDLWVGYNRRIFADKIHWRVQLNVSNVGVGDELIPITVQPNGTPAAYRIRPPQYIFLTNTFTF